MTYEIARSETVSTKHTCERTVYSHWPVHYATRAARTVVARVGDWRCPAWAKLPALAVNMSGDDAPAPMLRAVAVPPRPVMYPAGCDPA